MTRAVDEAMDASIKKQQYRGRIAKVDENLEYIWNRTENRGQYTYSINRESKIFKLLESHLDEDAKSYLDIVLAEIEKNVPFHQIYLDKSKNVIDETDNDERIAEIINNARMMLPVIMKLNASLSKEQAVENIFKSEPFCKHPELKQKILEKC